MPLAKRVPQRAESVFGSRDDKVRLAVEAFTLAAALAAALPRLFFDIKESQSTSDMTAIMFGQMKNIAMIMGCWSLGHIVEGLTALSLSNGLHLFSESDQCQSVHISG
jgi:hypothetical protein